MDIANNWKDYEIIDMANGEKLERWGDILLIRPDPQIIWKEKSFKDKWNKANARYNRSKTGGGSWEYKTKLPVSWQVRYKPSESYEDSSKLVTKEGQGGNSSNKELIFNIKPMGFKHTGLFPEQAVNWDWMIDKIVGAASSCPEPVKVLNLFAYTGGATVACLYAGAQVCHVDSSKGMCSWAKENVISSGLEQGKVRYLVDDVIKFVEREIRRGNKYDAIIMDPPSYGRGTNGEIWQFETSISDLVNLCRKTLSDNPLFFLINSYTTGISSTVLANLLEMYIQKDKKGKIACGELGLPMTNSNLILPCGIYGRWEK